MTHQYRASRLSALLLLAPLLLGGCTTVRSWVGLDDDTASTNIDPTKLSVEELYNNGADALNDQKYASAILQFSQVEQNYPYSSWAVTAQLMEGYAQYLQNKYTDAIGTLDHFIQLHPTHRDIAYAYYLRALSYYEQINDIKRDQSDTRKAMAALQEVVNRFPDSAYARDSKLKIDLCVDHLAGKEMDVGRWYEKQRLYTAAIGRFQTVVNDYQTTNHVPEALHRLTEIYLILGLKADAKRTAAVLGYNYPGNRWYESSYDALVHDQLVEAAPAPPPGSGVSSDPGDTPRPGFFQRSMDWLF
jgi:outer membrane protein assembly factor BamD